MPSLIGASILSYPGSLVDAYSVARKARRQGYNCVQLGPYRGLSLRPSSLRDIDKILPIYSYESAWREDDEPWPPLDKLIFVSPDVAGAKVDRLASFKGQLYQPLHISHHLGRGQLVELHPELLWRSPRETLDAVLRTGSRCVWDTFHCGQRDFSFVEPPAGIDAKKVLSAWLDWPCYLPLFAPHIKVVHVQPKRNSNQLEAWFAGRPTRLGSQLDALKNLAPYVEAWIVEVAPPSSKLKLPYWVATASRDMGRIQKKLSTML